MMGSLYLIMDRHIGVASLAIFPKEAKTLAAGLCQYLQLKEMIRYDIAIIPQIMVVAKMYLT